MQHCKISIKCFRNIPSILRCYVGYCRTSINYWRQVSPVITRVFSIQDVAPTVLFVAQYRLKRPRWRTLWEVEISIKPRNHETGLRPSRRRLQPSLVRKTKRNRESSYEVVGEYKVSRLRTVVRGRRGEVLSWMVATGGCNYRIEHQKCRDVTKGTLPVGLKVCELFTGVGVYISRVEEGSVAERAGLRPGDTILEVNGTPFRAVTHEEALKVSNIAQNSTPLEKKTKRNLVLYFKLKSQSIILSRHVCTFHVLPQHPFPLKVSVSTGKLAPGSFSLIKTSSNNLGQKSITLLFT